MKKNKEVSNIFSMEKEKFNLENGSENMEEHLTEKITEFKKSS